MRVKEEQFLKKTINEIKKFAKANKDASSFYAAVNDIEVSTLQDKSFNSDIDFFDKINFILSVITSIIVHPHISNKGENIILRADQVHSLQNDMFLKTMQDASLWKHNKDNEMIPEQVHYYQNVDELRIYENIFVVMLVNMLNDELNKYKDFYSTMILTLSNENVLSTSDDNVEVAFEKIDRLLKRIRKIKQTYFYRTISKGEKPFIRYVTPTNILLKDRLYNFCFKFYRQFITYEDKDELASDFTSYYYMLIVQALNNLGFTLKDNSHSSLTLQNKAFQVIVGLDKVYKGISFKVTYKNNKKVSAKHLLLVDHQSNFANATDNAKNIENGEYSSIESISIWNRAYLEKETINPIVQNPRSEKELIKQFLDDKLTIVTGSNRLYTHYCPICKERSIDIDDVSQICTCSSCSSSYIFDEKTEDTMWFIKIKRG